jgi:hypothetical protein
MQARREPQNGSVRNWRKVAVSLRSDVKELATHRLLPRCRAGVGPNWECYRRKRLNRGPQLESLTTKLSQCFSCAITEAENGMNRVWPIIIVHQIDGVLAHAAPPAGLVNGRPPALERIGGSTQSHDLTVNVCGRLVAGGDFYIEAAC